MIDPTTLFRNWTLFFEEVFVDSRPVHFVRKFEEESQEFIEKPSFEEASDSLACLIAWAHLNGGVHKLLEASERKLAVNWTRRWERQPDGTYHHVKEAQGTEGL